MKIYGAGLAGLLAGCIFPDAQIFEARSEGDVGHKALLRFRSRAVGDAVGIDFEEVKVNKAIWAEGREQRPSPRWANLYSKKVTGSVLDRSIWDIDPATRWIAPDDLLARLAERCKGRVYWDQSVDAELLRENDGTPVISTLPMPVMAQLVGVDAPKFERKGIHVVRGIVHGADVHQTIYFPEDNFTPYRASIVGHNLIIEATGHVSKFDVGSVMRAFGMCFSDVDVRGETTQEYGKLTPVDDAWRQQFIFELSQRHNIFSLGRFGTWRNILMDDVLDDIFVIKRLMKSGSYKVFLENAK